MRIDSKKWWLAFIAAFFGVVLFSSCVKTFAQDPETYKVDGVWGGGQAIPPPPSDISAESFLFGATALNNPSKAAVDPVSKSVFVIDTANNRVKVYDALGAFQRAWGSGGSTNGHFNSPGGIAIDSAQNVYVADTGNHRIQKFSNAGVWLATVGTYGSGTGNFNYPNGIAVDRVNSFLYVADANNNRIQKWSTATPPIFVSSIGLGYGSGNSQFNELANQLVIQRAVWSWSR